MASRSRNGNLPLIEDVFQHADQYEFHALVKLLEGLHPDKTSLGGGLDPAKEAIRIRARASLSFPNTDIYRLSNTKDEDVPPLLETNFLGIAGVTGPLPTPYTQLLLRRTDRKDTAFRDFLDIFNHRLVSFLHLIRKKYWVGIKHERPEHSYIGRSLISLLGLNGQYLRNRLGIEDRSLLYYTGLLWQRPRSCVALEQILSSFFKTQVWIKQFEGQWILIPEEQRTIIGAKGQYNALGKTTVLNARYWDSQVMFIVNIGPIGLEQYIDLLKPGKGYFQLTNIIRYYLGSHKEYRIRLNLKKEEIPTTRLGRGLALGWTTWINRWTPATENDKQAIFTTFPFTYSARKPAGSSKKRA